MEERIVCAANQYQLRSGETLTLLGARHWDVSMHRQCGQFIEYRSAVEVLYETEIQGFLTNTNRFVDRIEGWDIAYKAEQIRSIESWNKFKLDTGEGVLYSENLY